MEKVQNILLDLKIEILQIIKFSHQLFGDFEILNVLKYAYLFYSIIRQKFLIHKDDF